jgi:hypothetical protein
MVTVFLVLSMPKMDQGQHDDWIQFHLEVVEATRDLRVGHMGSHIRPTATQEHRQKVAEAKGDRS